MSPSLPPLDTEIEGKHIMTLLIHSISVYWWIFLISIHAAVLNMEHLTAEPHESNTARCQRRISLAYCELTQCLMITFRGARTRTWFNLIQLSTSAQTDNRQFILVHCPDETILLRICPLTSHFSYSYSWWWLFSGETQKDSNHNLIKRYTNTPFNSVYVFGCDPPECDSNR